MICPSCNGAKTERVLAHLSTGTCEVRGLNCFTCHGTGTVSDDYPQRLALARSYRELRIAFRLALHEVYEQSGVDYVRLSQFEHGSGELTVDELARLDQLYALLAGVS